MSELVIDTTQLRGLNKKLEKAAGKIQDKHDLLEMFAGLLEMQTKSRIADEKTDPSGKPWKKWSDSYAKTRGPHHSLLVSTGNLRDDIASEVEGDGAVVFTVRNYAGVQDAVRPFMGLSKDNIKEIEAETVEFLADLL